MDAFWELFSFEGRANRAWYFWHVVLDDMVIIGMLVMLVVLSGVFNTPFLVLPALGVLFGGIWAGTAITVKRLHDIDRPGWHFALFMVPFYNLYLMALCLLQPGTLGPNQFGPDPLGRAYLPPTPDTSFLDA